MLAYFFVFYVSTSVAQKKENYNYLASMVLNTQS